MQEILSIGANKKVRRLHILMDDLVIMRMLQGLGSSLRLPGGGPRLSDVSDAGPAAGAGNRQRRRGVLSRANGNCTNNAALRHLRHRTAPGKGPEVQLLHGA